MNPGLDRSIEALRTRAFQGAFLGELLRGLALGGAIVATGVLVARLGFAVETRAASLAFGVLAIVPFVAWWRARRALPSRAAAAAWLDVRGGGSGAIVALDEVRDPRWEAALERELARERPLPAIRVARPARFAAGAAAFALLAAFVPVPAPVVGPPTRVQEALLSEVEERFEALQEQVELEPEVAAELQDALERLRQDGALAEPEAAFEALDRAQDRLEQEAYERAELAQSASQDLARNADAAARDAEAAQADLERTLEQLAQGGFAKDVQSALEKELGAAGVSLPPGTKLDAGAIEAISKELAEKLGLQAGELAKKGLLGSKSLAKLSELAKLDGFEPTEHVCDASCERKPGGT